MGSTRREFIKDMAVTGAAVTAVGSAGTVEAQSDTAVTPDENERCPYFDQPLFCKDLSETGRPMCEDQ